MGKLIIMVYLFFWFFMVFTSIQKYIKNRKYLLNKCYTEKLTFSTWEYTTLNFRLSSSEVRAKRIFLNLIQKSPKQVQYQRDILNM